MLENLYVNEEIIEMYESYCYQKKLYPWTCPMFRLNAFINYAYNDLKYNHSNIKVAIKEIGRRHTNKKLLEHPMIKRTLDTLTPVISQENTLTAPLQGFS